MHSLSRRDFLRATAAVAGSAFAIPGLTLAEEKKEYYGGYKFGIQSYTFRKFSLEQCLVRLEKLGMRYAEFYPGHLPANATPEQTKAALKLCSDHGVTPVSWGVQGFSKDHEANKKSFEFAQAIGINFMSASPDPDSFDSLDKLCDTYKIAIGIHPHGPVGGGKLDRWYSAEIIMAAVKDHHELIGSCLDTGHLIRSAQLGKELDVPEQIRIMGKRNFGFHLKDHNNKTKTDVIFGQDGGVLDMVAVMKAIREVKFKGWISVEYEAKEAEPTEDVKGCLAVVQAAIQKLG